MTTLRFIAMSTSEARHFQSGGADAYDLKPERRVSDGDGVPCRHCLKDVAVGEDYLVLAYRPFQVLQPYAETGADFPARGALRTGIRLREHSADAGQAQGASDQGLWRG